MFCEYWTFNLHYHCRSNTKEEQSSSYLIMAQPQAQMQRPYLAQPTAPAQTMLPNKLSPLPQHKAPLNTINSLYNGTILQTGRLFRSANIRRNRNDPSINLRAAILADAESLQQQMSSMIPQFHNAVDDLEEEIVRARAVIMRDLREVRKRKAESNMTAQERREVDKKEHEKVVEKEVEREIEQAADAMVDVATAAPRISEERKDGQANEHGEDVNMGAGHDAVKGGRQTDIISIGDTTVTDNSEVMDEIWKDETAKAGNAQHQQQTQFPNTSGPQRPLSQSPAIPPSMNQAQQMHLMQQRQAAMAQQQRQQPPPPHTPMQQNRTMPEDNIAFSALPGSTTNSPGKPNRSPVVVLPPPSHHVVTQQGGLNIPAESLPLLPEHLRSQMAQVQTQAVIEGKGQQAGGGQALNHPHVHPEFFVSDSPPGGTPPRNFTPPPNFQAPQSQQQITSNPSQPQPNQPNLASPFEGQPVQAQTQAQQNPEQAHDNIDFDAMFAADAGGNHDLNAADGDINFDDFFNDIVGDAAAQGSGDDNANTNNQISGLEGANETGVADFDLASFGLDDGGANSAGNNDTLASMGDGNMGGGGSDNHNANANAAVGLGLGMLDGLEQYANQATGDDPMDGLDFPDLPMDNNVNLNPDGETQHGGAGQANTSTSQPGANNSAGTQAQAQDFDMGNMQMSNEELDAAMNSMDQETSFDDLLDGMYNDGGGGLDGAGGGNVGGETSEFDDAFFNM